jgi:probable HAF family extracellular repeat protein
LGLNEQGNVVGFCYQNDESNAFLYRYSDGSIQDIGSIGGKATAATAINNANQIVGYSADGSNNVLAFSYVQNQGITSLGTLVGGSNSEAFALNASGQIVGRYEVGDGSTHAFRLASGRITDLGTLGGANSEALGINQSGVIVGDSETGNGTRPKGTTRERQPLRTSTNLGGAAAKTVVAT